MRKPKTVFVLGAGPAGLLATHALAQVLPKAKVIVLSQPAADGKVKKSELYGCQYLHGCPDGLESVRGKGTPVAYEVLGEPHIYREKVYGTSWSGNTSVDEYGPEGAHQAWDLRVAYDELWQRYAHLMIPLNVSGQSIRPMMVDTKAAVLSTIPATALCVNQEHHFDTKDVWAVGSKDAQDAQQRLPYLAPENTIQCNGSYDTAWYRAATVFGYSTLEWPLAKKPPMATVAQVRKPLHTDCTCWLDRGVVRLGRYGQWAKGVLVHEVYNQVKGMYS